MNGRRPHAGILIMSLVGVALTVTVHTSPAAAVGGTAPVPVVFDTDMDYDDAAALAYLSQEHKSGRIDLRAVTITNSGAGHAGSAIRNARCLLRRFGLGHIPVADGSPAALHLVPPELRLGVELVMTTVLFGCTESSQPAPVSAARLLVDSIRSAPSDVMLITTGPLSNVAGALQVDAGAVRERLAGVFVMGGAVSVPGNLCCTTTLGFDNTQELNMWVDPPAAQETFRSLPDGSLSLVALDATRYVPITGAFADRLRADQHTPEAQIVAAIATHPLVTLTSLLGMVYWWDPLTVVAATRPGVVSYTVQPIVVVQDGASSGRTVPSLDGRPMHVAGFADQARFEQTFLDTLNARTP